MLQFKNKHYRWSKFDVFKKLEKEEGIIAFFVSMHTVYVPVLRWWFRPFYWEEDTRNKQHTMFGYKGRILSNAFAENKKKSNYSLHDVYYHSCSSFFFKWDLTYNKCSAMWIILALFIYINY